MRIFLSLMIVWSISFNSIAEIAKLPSLEWQVQDLEVNITKKIDGLLRSVLTTNQYAVNVEIITSQPKDPEFNKKDEDSEEDNKNHDELNKELEQLIARSKETDKKLEESVAVAEKKAEIAKATEETVKLNKEKKNLNKVKFLDTSPDENKFGDNVVFSKFGMEAPLVDDFNDLSPDGKIVLTMTSSTNQKDMDEENRLKKLVDEKDKALDKIDRDMQRKEREFSMKEAALVNKIRMSESEAKKDDKKASPVEQVWKYNTSVDVFKNLREVNIKVQLSKGLSEDLKQKVEGYVRGMKFNLGRVVPKIKFEYVVLGSDLATPTKAQVMKEWIELFSKYANLVGLVLAVIILGFVGSKLIQKYFEQSTGNTSTGNFKMENRAEDKEKEEAALTGAGGSGGSGESTLGVFGLNGVERFKFYMKSAPNDAVLLVKKWISSDEKSPKDALRAIVQQMENEELGAIFSKLSSGQKVIWRELLNGPLMASELGRANDYISNQIIQNVIIPSAITDPSTYDLILKLTPEKVVNLVRQEPQVVAILMNILSGTFINEVLSQCSSADRDKIINESLSLTQEQIAGQQESVKKILQRVVENREPKPFIDKLLGLVHMASPEVEESLHRALGKNFSREQLKKMGMDLFPAALITDLPVGFIKSLISSYPMEKRMRLLYSLDEETRSFFTNIVAAQGTKAADMINLEFEKIESDASEVEKIEQESSQIWFEFVTFVRKEIKTDKTYSRDVSELVNAWAEDLYQEPIKLERVS